MKTCAYCGFEFTPADVRNICCSAKCQSERDKQLKRDARGWSCGRDVQCITCGKTFQAFSPRSRYCAKDCHNAKKREYMATYERIRKPRSNRNRMTRDPKPNPAVVARIERGCFAILRFNHE